ncbi:hypothetical protein AB3Z07_04970 [Metabacillus halosaccharovorans]|uniref:hypothetical protein n=1 Tax=Metabacillus halosaccharovorans TaxID=930124 RepID=UPI0034CE9E7D
MQAKALERDATKDYISNLQKEFMKLQLHSIQLSKEHYLKTEFILSNDIIMQSYVDYLKKLTIEDNYMSISDEDINNQIDLHDISDDEIEQYLAAPY